MKKERLEEQVKKIADQLQKARLMEYAELLQSPKRIIWLNLLAGMAKGVGFTIGITFFTVLIFYFLRYLGALNLPIVGDYIADLVRIVQKQL